MVMPDLGTPHAAEKFLRPIRASAVQAVRLFVVDALHLITGMQIVPGAGFVGVNDGALGDTGLDE